jgi:hypothetical protein
MSIRGFSGFVTDYAITAVLDAGAEWGAALVWPSA